MSVTRSVTQPLSWLDRNESDRRAAGLRRLIGGRRLGAVELWPAGAGAAHRHTATGADCDDAMRKMVKPCGL